MPSSGQEQVVSWIPSQIHEDALYSDGMFRFVATSVSCIVGVLFATFEKNPTKSPGVCGSKHTGIFAKYDRTSRDMVMLEQLPDFNDIVC